MKFPPKPKTPYIFKNEQEKRIFDKLVKFSERKLTKEQKKIIKFLYSQLEADWQDPLEKFVDELLK